MADPEGNEFCVLEPRPSTGHPGRSPRWWWTAPTRARWPGSGGGDGLDAARGHRRPRGHAVARGVGPYLEFLRTPDTKSVWNRVHLDVSPYPGDDSAAEEARLRALGATESGNRPVLRPLEDPDRSGRQRVLLAQPPLTGGGGVGQGDAPAKAASAQGSRVRVRREIPASPVRPTTARPPAAVVPPRPEGAWQGAWPAASHRHVGQGGRPPRMVAS